MFDSSVLEGVLLIDLHLFESSPGYLLPILAEIAVFSLLLAELLPKIRRFSLKKMDKPYPYRKAKVYQGDKIYIEFWAWSHSKNKLVRKRVFKILGNNKREKLQEARKIANNINQLLKDGHTLADNEKDQEDKVLVSLRLLDAVKKAIEIKKQGGSKSLVSQLVSLQNRFETWATQEKIERIPLPDFNKQHAFKFLDWLKYEYEISNRTRNNYLDFLRIILNLMVDREWISKNPTKGIKKLKTVSQQHAPFTSIQQEILEEYLLKTNYPLYVFTRMIYYCFLRPIELMRLKVRDIDIKNRVILIRSSLSKTGKQQPVWIPKNLYPLLTEFLKKYPHSQNDYIFSKAFKPGHSQWHRNRFSEAHRRALESTDMYDGLLTGYSWKHTGVCNAYRAGVDIKSIQEQCRHHSLQETETYLRSLGLRISSDLKNAEW